MVDYTISHFIRDLHLANIWLSSTSFQFLNAWYLPWSWKELQIISRRSSISQNWSDHCMKSQISQKLPFSRYLLELCDLQGPWTIVQGLELKLNLWMSLMASSIWFLQDFAMNTEAGWGLKTQESTSKEWEERELHLRRKRWEIHRSYIDISIMFIYFLL